MDIRTEHNTRSITFADCNGGTGKAVKFEYAYPVQFEIISHGGDKIHIKHEDIDNVIKSLYFIKEHWGENKEAPAWPQPSSVSSSPQEQKLKSTEQIPKKSVSLWVKFTRILGLSEK